MPTTKEMQVSNMFNKIMVVIQAQSEQIQAQSEQSQAQSVEIPVVQAQSEQIQTQMQLLLDRAICTEELKDVYTKCANRVQNVQEK